MSLLKNGNGQVKKLKEKLSKRRQVSDIREETYMQKEDAKTKTVKRKYISGYCSVSVNDGHKNII